MLDRWTIRIFRNPLNRLAARLKQTGCRPDHISFGAFGIGMAVLPALYLHHYWLALICIVVNRIGDGLDGALARMTQTSDAGSFLDIVLDFIFYSAVVFGFAVANPEVNGLAAATLLFSFVGTGSSFLAFAILAERRGIENIVYPQKGIYYLSGLAEGTETLIFFVLFCIFPDHFPILAYVLAVICLITVLTRVIGGYYALR
ncbi:MAG: CDP-alcohol phosphatidyltransferase family protein [Desulforhopalus sp.]